MDLNQPVIPPQQQSSPPAPPSPPAALGHCRAEPGRQMGVTHWSALQSLVQTKSGPSQVYSVSAEAWLPPSSDSRSVPNNANQLDTWKAVLCCLWGKQVKHGMCVSIASTIAVRPGPQSSVGTGVREVLGARWNQGAVLRLAGALWAAVSLGQRTGDSPKQILASKTAQLIS